jgi:hypothetical protein
MGKAQKVANIVSSLLLAATHRNAEAVKSLKDSKRATNHSRFRVGFQMGTVRHATSVLEQPISEV